MTDPEILPSAPAPATPAVPPPPPNTAFRGPNGMRAGWRVLIFLAISGGLVIFLGIVLAVVMRVVMRGKTYFAAISQLTPVGLSITEGMIFLLTAVPALIMARIERRKFGQYGLPASAAFRGHFWIGVLVGFLSISACLLAIFAFHGFRLTGLAIHGSAIISATAAWGATFILVGLAEEFSTVRPGSLAEASARRRAFSPSSCCSLSASRLPACAGRTGINTADFGPLTSDLRPRTSDFGLNTSAIGIAARATTLSSCL
ncbi:MAG: hypothetical protein ACRD3B_18630 [Candidatus Sulfotelmatobacter sp.]